MINTLFCYLFFIYLLIPFADEDENAAPQLQPEMMEYLWSDLNGFYSQMNPVDLITPPTSTAPTSTPTSASQLWMKIFSLLNLESREAGKGESVLMCGGESHSLYYVRSGVCRVFCGGDNKRAQGSAIGWGPRDSRVELGALSSGHTFNEKGFLSAFEELKRTQFSSKSPSPPPSSSSSSSSSSLLDCLVEKSNIEVTSAFSETVTLYSLTPEDVVPFFHHYPSLEPLLLSLIALQLTTKVRLLTDKVCDQQKQTKN